MHPATEYWLGFFETAHLPAPLKVVVGNFRQLALEVADGPANQSTTEAVKTLVRAKDEACRAIVASGALSNPQ